LPLHLFGLPRRYSRSLAGTNLQPRCCAALLPTAASVWPALLPAPLHRFGLLRRYSCLPAGTNLLLLAAVSFWPALLPGAASF
jgi:hypothetical protein